MNRFGVPIEVGYKENNRLSRWHPKPCYTCKKYRLKTIEMHSLSDDESECDFCHVERIKNQKLTFGKKCSNCGRGDKTTRGIEPFDIITIHMNEIDEDEGIYVCDTCIRGWELDKWWEKNKSIEPSINPNQDLIDGQWTSRPLYFHEQYTENILPILLSKAEYEEMHKASLALMESAERLGLEAIKKLMEDEPAKPKTNRLPGKRRKKVSIMISGTDYTWETKE